MKSVIKKWCGSDHHFYKFAHFAFCLKAEGAAALSQCRQSPFMSTIQYLKFDRAKLPYGVGTTEKSPLRLFFRHKCLSAGEPPPTGEEERSGLN